MTKKVYVGPIVKKTTDRMYGFTVAFNNITDAKKYKEAFIWYIESDNKKVMRRKGYYE